MQKTRNRPCWLVALLLLGLPACKDEAVRRDSGPAVDRPSTVDAPPAATDGGTGTATKTVSYTEPTTITGATACSTTGGALTNLDHTTIYYSIGTKPPVIAATIPATSPGGGGSVTKAVTVTGLAPGANPVKFWVTATNSKQQESDPTCSQQVTLTIP